MAKLIEQNHCLFSKWERLYVFISKFYYIMTIIFSGMQTKIEKFLIKANTFSLCPFNIYIKEMMLHY